MISAFSEWCFWARSWELHVTFWYGAGRRCTCPAGHVIYAQIAMYMMLSFFTTWFSNPATWFYLVVTGIIYMYVKS
ncbi:MAG: hypothetical protein ACLTW9_07580 [Enterocloster sp.]